MACGGMDRNLYNFLEGVAEGVSPLRKICVGGSVILKGVLKK